MTEKGAEICFIVVFNHKYEQNLGKLREIYKERFHNILFLMPFYQGNEVDVIPVYEDSRYFQGFFQQAFNRYYKPDKFTHYIFIADDLLLNPKINENNILQELNIDINTGFIRNISNLNRLYYLYVHITGVMSLFRKIPKDLRQELPKEEILLKKKKELGLSPDIITLKNLIHWDGGLKLKDFIKYKSFWKAPFFLLKQRQLPYPLVNGYSDLIIIPSNAIQEFCHLCGLMSSINLWVEYAIPTAMLLSCNKISTELAIGENFFSEKTSIVTGWKGTLLFKKNGLKNLEKTYNNNLQSLFKSFGEKELYLHPVKLSRWK